MSARAKTYEDPDGPGFDDDEEAEIEYDPGDGKDDAAILAVKHRHEARIMAIPGVRGLGVTQNRIGDSAIAVYVQERAVAASVPKSLDGYGVEIIVVGEIDAY